MTGLNIPFDDFSTNVFENTSHRFVKDTIINRIRNANNFQRVSLGILGVFPALPCSFDKPPYKSVVNSPNDSNISFQLF